MVSGRDEAVVQEDSVFKGLAPGSLTMYQWIYIYGQHKLNLDFFFLFLE